MKEQSREQIKAALDALLLPGCTYEVRIPKVRKGNYSTDIERYRSILIDCDPSRKSQISSTDEELQGALTLRDEIVTWLAKAGFPEPVVAMSGNGAHARYRVDFEVNQDTTATVQRFLHALAQRFDTDKVKVDTGVFNPSRICKVYGTMSRKGDFTVKRPHRRSYIERVPEPYQEVPYVLLEQIAGMYEPPEEPTKPAVKPARRNGSSHCALSSLDVPAFLSTHGIQYNKEKTDRQGRSVWRLETCPFCGESDKSAVVTQGESLKDNGKYDKPQHHMFLMRPEIRKKILGYVQTSMRKDGHLPGQVLQKTRIVPA